MSCIHHLFLCLITFILSTVSAIDECIPPTCDIPQRGITCPLSTSTSTSTSTLPIGSISVVIHDIFDPTYLYLADITYHRIIRVSTSMNITTYDTTCSTSTYTSNNIIAGSSIGVADYRDGDGNMARFASPRGMTMTGNIHPNGTYTRYIYVADTGNHVIRLITIISTSTFINPYITVTTLAGRAGIYGYVDATPLSSLFRSPMGLALTSTSLYIADSSNHVIRRMSRINTSQNITTIAGTPNVAGLRDGINSLLSYPHSLAVAHPTTSFQPITSSTCTTTGDILYLSHAHAVSLIDACNAVYTLAGGLTPGLRDGIIPSTSTSTQFYAPQGLYVDMMGILYIADNTNARIRTLSWYNTTHGYVDTFLGDGMITSIPQDPLATTLMGPTSISLPINATLTYTTHMYVAESSQLRRITSICDQHCEHGGICTSSNACTCPMGYTGSACEWGVCDTPCPADQLCVGPNTCACPDGYGPIPNCHTPICSAGCVHGTCTSPDTCTCASGWTGINCSIAICTSPCSSHGICTSPDTCTCSAGWNGTTCDNPICTPSCINNGTCIAPDTCTCSSGWNGSQCEIPICTQTCHNDGICTSPNTCTCDATWSGWDCSIPLCTPICGVNGTCTSQHTCQCDAGWDGPTCTSPVCPQTCKNGATCTSPSICTCTPGWSGVDCSIPICNITSCTSLYGAYLCTAPYTCISACSPLCQHGTCTGVNNCTCTAGWRGVTCDIPICTSPCINGTCTAPNTCTCISTYQGPTCAQPKCANCPQGKGICTAPDQCKCKDGWEGKDCTTPVCSLYVNQTLVTTNRCLNGTCSAPDTCNCTQGYQGKSCEQPICGGTTPCSSQGVCIAPSVCQCDSNWQGLLCDTPVAHVPGLFEANARYIYPAMGAFFGIMLCCALWIARAKLDRARFRRYKYQTELGLPHAPHKEPFGWLSRFSSESNTRHHHHHHHHHSHQHVRRPSGTHNLYETDPQYHPYPDEQYLLRPHHKKSRRTQRRGSIRGSEAIATVIAAAAAGGRDRGNNSSGHTSRHGSRRNSRRGSVDQHSTKKHHRAVSHHMSKQRKHSHHISTEMTTTPAAAAAAPTTTINVEPVHAPIVTTPPKPDVAVQVRDV